MRVVSSGLKVALAAVGLRRLALLGTTALILMAGVSGCLPFRELSARGVGAVRAALSSAPSSRAGRSPSVEGASADGPSVGAGASGASVGVGTPPLTATMPGQAPDLKAGPAEPPAYSLTVGTPTGYPRMAYFWCPSKSPAGDGFFGGWDLFIPYKMDDPQGEIATIRKTNPNTRILQNLDVTHGRPGDDPLATAWWNAKPGDPGYKCLMRDTKGTVLLVKYWGHPMYNMTVPYCRQPIVERNVTQYGAQKTADGHYLYDGIFWDLLWGYISWLSPDLDSNLDGKPDDPATVNAAYRAGVEDVLTQIRAAFPDAILGGNEADLTYAHLINGRMIEWQLSALLNHTADFTWDDVFKVYRSWSAAGVTPRATFIQTKPEEIYEAKNPFGPSQELPIAMDAEGAASYQRMRFGLTTALMGDALFSYDVRIEDGGVWWYDEFGAPVGAYGRAPGSASTLPPRGYLGLPTGDPRLLIDHLDSPDQMTNGGFEQGLNGWQWYVSQSSGAVATAEVQPGAGIWGTSGFHATVTRPADPWNVQLQQAGKSTVAGANYTLSFWARSSVTTTLTARIAKVGPPGTNYGFLVHADVTPQWQHFQLWDDATVTANDGEIEFRLGGTAGEVWLDDVQFQPGAIGVWGRPFEKGLAVINTTTEVQQVPLSRQYCKLNGSQAPLFQVRVDDDEAEISGAWSTFNATVNQFGKTIRVAGGPRAKTVYVPNLAYGGLYEVLAWVAPNATQSSAVPVVIRGSKGEATAYLDESTGEIGWRSLGRYEFDAGTGGSASVVAAGAAPGEVVADALKWVSVARYNDGSETSQVTLQPLDGIVLLTECYTPTQVFLPAAGNR